MSSAPSAGSLDTSSGPSASSGATGSGSRHPAINAKANNMHMVFFMLFCLYLPEIPEFAPEEGITPPREKFS